MSTHERVQVAKDKVERIVDAARHLVQINATNRIVLYSPTLSEQVGQSYAAHAFNAFQRALFENELVRLCSLWDAVWDERKAVERDSIPAIVWLVGEEAVQDALAKETLEYWANQPVAPVLESSMDEATRTARANAILAHNRRTGEKQAAKARKWLAEALDRVRDVTTSDNFRSLRNFRDKNLAHLLTVTTHEKAGPIAMPKYGDEHSLLDQTIEVIDLLHLAVNGSDFGWDEAREASARYARALWHGCSFKVLE